VDDLRRWPVVAVAAAGVAGATLRWGAVEVIATTGRWPTATFAVNLLGAAVLGWLLTVAPAGRHREPSVAGRVGFCGALTTFSALAVETARFGREGAWTLAVTYPAATLAAGLACFHLGRAVARR
jgi:CrcB protein